MLLRVSPPFDPNRAAREQQWVERIRAGDVAAFEAMFRAYAVPLAAYAYRYTRSRAIAEELVQDVLFRVWERREAWELRDTLNVYLYSAIRNRTLDFLKHERVARRLEERVEREEIMPGMSQHAREIDAELQQQEFIHALHQAIETLPERCRQTYILHRQHHLTYAEIGKVMEVSEKTVKAQMGRALSVLRRALAAWIER
jgi:RNA polymerase sigma-70 factor (ECF subfamily)